MDAEVAIAAGLGILTVPLLLVLLALAAESLAALLPRSRATVPATLPKPRVAVLIPAHNEELGLARTLASVVGQLQPGDRCVVVADNCQDHTAEVARRLPVEVLERFDEKRRGKGFALDHGIRHLRQDAPDVLVIIDADCSVAAGSLAQLAMATAASGRPVQAGNTLVAPARGGLRDRVSAFAFLLKNHVRPLGLARLGGPSPLFGTGLALPWRLIDKVNLATGNNVEDLQLGIELALAGSPAWYLAIPCVSGQFPTDGALALAQRRRWEHGHVRTLVRQVPRLLCQAVVQRRFDLAAMAMDLAIPPLSLTAVVAAALTALHVLAWLALGTSGWLIAMLAAETVAVLAVSLAWVRFGRDSLGFGDLVRLPAYVCWKLPMYAALLFRPERGWCSLNRLHGK